MAWYHFEFDNGSNPYIAIRNDTFFKMIRRYNVEQIGEKSFVVHSEKPKHKYTREYNRDMVRDFAMDWQRNFERFEYSYQDIADYEDFFREYGGKYGLLTEFHENCIC